MRRMVRRAGWDIVRIHHAGVRYLDHVPATAFESVLLRVTPSLDRLTFIQVGANDGRRYDPIFPFVNRHRWSGVLIEPVPEYFRCLQQTYAENQHLTLVNAALDVQEGTRPIFRIRPDLPGLPDWTHGLASLDEARVRQAATELGLDASAVVVESIATITWANVWQRLDERRCDLLVIDTEGYDIRLLRLAGLAEHRPRIVQFEHACVTADERFSFYRELSNLGYEISTHEGDTTAHLPR